MENRSRDQPSLAAMIKKIQVRKYYTILYEEEN